MVCGGSTLNDVVAVTCSQPPFTVALALSTRILDAPAAAVVPVHACSWAPLITPNAATKQSNLRASRIETLSEYFHLAEDYDGRGHQPELV